ncbi:hypothetical protein VDGL01_04379 [Verticillium dahliae]
MPGVSPSPTDNTKTTRTVTTGRPASWRVYPLSKEKATDHATFDASQVGTSGNPITSPRHIRPTDEREHKNGASHSKYTNKDCDR